MSEATETPPGGVLPLREGITPWIGFGAMILGQFMAYLDIQIVASSLVQIQAGIGASADEISWVQTAYIIPEVVMIPLSSYLSRLWGTQRTYLLSCAGFLGASVLTGLSTSIEMMIATRALQGFLGGAMIPTTFTVAFTAFGGERRVTAGIVTGMIVTLGPALGPALGGWITENLSWNWLFFINVVPGIVSIVLTARYGAFDRGDPSLKEGFDWIGLFSMAGFLMALQYVLEEGAGDSWFQSETIVLLTFVSLVCAAVFFWRTVSYANPIISLEAFKNRNFAVGVLFTTALGLQMFSSNFLLPLFLGRVGGYSAGEIGKVMSVFGLCMFLVGPLMSRLMRMFDPRLLVTFGLILSLGTLLHARHLTPEWGYDEFFWMQVIRAVGMMMCFGASQQITMATLPPHLVRNASGIVNLGRNVGGAVGLAIVTTIVGVATRQQLVDQSARMSVADPQAAAMLQGLVTRMQEMGVADPEGAARKAMAHMIERNALTAAFAEGFVIVALMTAIVFLVLVIGRPDKPPLYGAVESKATESH